MADDFLRDLAGKKDSKPPILGINGDIVVLAEFDVRFGAHAIWTSVSGGSEELDHLNTDKLQKILYSVLSVDYRASLTHVQAFLCNSVAFSELPEDGLCNISVHFTLLDIMARANVRHMALVYLSQDVSLLSQRYSTIVQQFSWIVKALQFHNKHQTLKNVAEMTENVRFTEEILEGGDTELIQKHFESTGGRPHFTLDGLRKYSSELEQFWSLLHTVSVDINGLPPILADVCYRSGHGASDAGFAVSKTRKVVLAIYKSSSDKGLSPIDDICGKSVMDAAKIYFDEIVSDPKPDYPIRFLSYLFGSEFSGPEDTLLNIGSTLPFNFDLIVSKSIPAHHDLIDVKRLHKGQTFSFLCNPPQAALLQGKGSDSHSPLFFSPQQTRSVPVYPLGCPLSPPQGKSLILSQDQSFSPGSNKEYSQSVRHFSKRAKDSRTTHVHGHPTPEMLSSSSEDEDDFSSSRSLSLKPSFSSSTRCLPSSSLQEIVKEPFGLPSDVSFEESSSKNMWDTGSLNFCSDDETPYCSLRDLLQQTNLAPHIIYSLLIGRPLVVIGSQSSAVAHTVRLLSVFVAGPHQTSVCTFRRKPLTVPDLAHIRLVGLPQHPSFIHSAARSIVSILRVDKTGFPLGICAPPCPPDSVLIPELIGKDISWLDDASFRAHIHERLFKHATTSFLYYHICAAGITYFPKMEEQLYLPKPLSFSSVSSPVVQSLSSSSDQITSNRRVIGTKSSKRANGNAVVGPSNGSVGSYGNEKEESVSEKLQKALDDPAAVFSTSYATCPIYKNARAAAASVLCGLTGTCPCDIEMVEWLSKSVQLEQCYGPEKGKGEMPVRMDLRPMKMFGSFEEQKDKGNNIDAGPSQNPTKAK